MTCYFPYSLSNAVLNLGALQRIFKTPNSTCSFGRDLNGYSKIRFPSGLLELIHLKIGEKN